MFERVIQYTDEVKSEAAAERSLAFCRMQVDFRGGRVLPPRWPYPDEWRVQAFFEDVDVVEEAALPDGCRRVLAPRRLLKPLAIVLLAGLMMMCVGRVKWVTL